MKTSEFKYLNFPFVEFNTAQRKVIPLVTQDKNLIVSFPPGTGKTVIAEACFAYHLKTSDKNMIYVSPLKALANQKFSDWSNSFKDFGLFVISGDTDTKLSEVENKRLGLFTVESLDSCLRKPKDEFIKNVGCVCFDEAHLIGDESRGGAYESAIINVVRTCPEARLVLLSGTLSNAKEVAKWIKFITQKETALAVTDWRPIEFGFKYHYVERYSEIKKVVELLRTYKNSKTIVFVHSKITGKLICDDLKKAKIRHVYHNGSLPESKRKHIEALFSDKYSTIDVIVATSTLAAGINI